MRKPIILASIIACAGCAHVGKRAAVVRVEDLDKPPHAVSQPPMEYTEVWHRSRIQAQATVALTIQEDGSVTDVGVVRATNPEIARAAIDAVKKWRFEPPTCRGAPARVTIKTSIVSNLENTRFVMP